MTVERREDYHRHLFFFVCSAHTHTTPRGSQLGCVGQRDKTEHPILSHGKLALVRLKKKGAQLIWQVFYEINASNE